MFRVVWEYRARPERRDEFERHYAPTGTWAQFFGRCAAFRGTTFARAPNEPGHYVTVDAWDSATACREFLAEHAREYAALDRSFEALTLEERLVGEFEDVG